MEKSMLAPCGIDCAECGSYKATMGDLDAAEGLVEWYRGMGWIGKKEGARAVLKKAPLCKGCRDRSEDCFFKCGHGCDLYPCCRERQIDHCGECGDFPCERYNAFASKNAFYQKAKENLLSLRANPK